MTSLLRNRRHGGLDKSELLAERCVLGSPTASV